MVVYLRLLQGRLTTKKREKGTSLRDTLFFVVNV